MYLMHKNLTNQIIKTFYDVYNELGHGFLENVYQNALYLELKTEAFMSKHKNKLKFITRTLKSECIMLI